MGNFYGNILEGNDYSRIENLYAQYKKVKQVDMYVGQNLANEVLQAMIDIIWGKIPYDFIFHCKHLSEPNSEPYPIQTVLKEKGMTEIVFTEMYYYLMNNNVKFNIHDIKGNKPIIPFLSGFGKSTLLKLAAENVISSKDNLTDLSKIFDIEDTLNLSIYEMNNDGILPFYMKQAYTINYEEDEKGNLIEVEEPYVDEKLKKKEKVVNNALKGGEIRTTPDYFKSKQLKEKEFQRELEKKQQIKKQQEEQEEQKKYFMQENEKRNNFIKELQQQVDDWQKNILNKAKYPYDKTINPIFTISVPEEYLKNIKSHDFKEFKKEITLNCQYPSSISGYLRILQDLSNGLLFDELDIFDDISGIKTKIIYSSMKDFEEYGETNRSLNDVDEIIYPLINHVLFANFIIPKIMNKELVFSDNTRNNKVFSEYVLKNIGNRNLVTGFLLAALFNNKIKPTDSINELKNSMFDIGTFDGDVLSFIKKNGYGNYMSSVTSKDIGKIDDFIDNIRNGEIQKQVKTEPQSNNISKLNKSIVDTPKEEPKKIEKVKAPTSLLNYVTSEKDKNLLQLLEDTYWDTKLTAQQIETKSKIIINKLTDINAVTDSGETALYIVLSRENTKETVKAMKDVVSLIMESGYDLNKPIHPINEYKKPTFIEIVVVNSLEEGIDRTSGKGYDLAEFLYNCGADYFNKENANGKSGYEFAKSNSDTKTVGFLEDISKKPRVNPFVKK